MVVAKTVVIGNNQNDMNVSLVAVVNVTVAV